MPNEFLARNGLIAQNNSTISGSLNVTAGITGSLLGTASFAATASYLTGYISPFPYTGSAIISGSLTVTGSLNTLGNITSTGTLTAQTLVVQTVTSSVSFITGSTRFGSLAANTHVFTGSIGITGSVTATSFAGSGANLTSIPNAALTNSTISGVALGSNLATLTISTGLSGTSYNGSGAVTIANTGVTSNVAGTGISVSGATGAVTITNSGVTSIVAGTNISISGATGAVTITNGITNNNQLTNGAGYITSYTETDTLGSVTNRGSSTSQNITFSNGRKGLIGVYDATQTQAIFAMGAAYVLTDGGASSTIGPLYGLAWSYNPDYGGAGNNPQSKAGLNHQLLHMQNGVTTAAIGSGIWTSGNISAANFSGTHSGTSSGTNTGDQTNISGNAATATTAPSGTNRGDQIHGTVSVTPATSFASMPSSMSGFTDNWGAGDLPSGMGHVHGIACRHFNNTSNLWGWHMVGQYDIPGDLRVRWVNAGTWTAYYQLLSSSNYNNYSPTLTGTGASGTWAINVTGTAGSAPNASNANAYYNVTPGGGYGLKFWSSDSYKISMGSSALYYYGPVTDYSIKMQMDDGSAGRGFTWGRESYAPIAGLNGTSGNMQIAGAFTAGGDVTAYSDARVKTNVEVIENAIEKIKAIRGVTFNRTDMEHDTKRHAGVIAQEILAVLPEVVTTNQDGMYSVAYGNLAGLFIEAIKEQQIQIEELKTIINGLTR
jgi:hypothetical protein